MTDVSGNVTDQRAVAARLAARSEIRDIRMFESSVKLKSIPFDDDQLMYQLDMRPGSVECNTANTAFVIRITYTLRLERAAREGEDEQEHVRIAKLKFVLAGFFQLDMREGDEPPTDHEFEAYASTTGAFALYPFAREYVHDITSRMRLPSLTLGVFIQPITKQEANQSLPSAEN